MIKHKKIKMILSAIIALSLILTALPLSKIDFSFLSLNAKAANGVDWIYDKDDDTLVVIGYGGSVHYNYVMKETNPAHLIISLAVTGIDESAFSNLTRLKDVKIMSSLDSIDENAFFGCNSLESVTFYGNVGSIGAYAFAYCPSLTEFTIPDSVTSIGNGAFCDCTALKSMVIPENVKSIGLSLFEGCSSLTSVTLPQHLTDIPSYTFCDCASLSDFTIPPNVTRIGTEAFYNCASLKKITIPGKVTEIGKHAFKHCAKLTEIVIPKSVMNIGIGAFAKCGSLILLWVDIDNPAYDTRNGCNGIVNSSTDEFVAGCNESWLPDGVVSIADEAFSGCVNLTKIKIPSSVKAIGSNAFNGCYSLSDLTIPASVKSIDTAAFANCTSLKSITIPNGINTVKGSLFSGCTNLTSVTLPDTVTEIGKYAFCDCTSLNNITIPDNVDLIDNYSFYGCESLTTFNIPDNIISIGKEVFSGCSNIVNIKFNSAEGIRHWCNSSGNSSPFWYAHTYNVFLNNRPITNLILPEDTYFVRELAFYNCPSITSVTIPNTLLSISSYAFESCANIKDVYYIGTPSEWTALYEKIGDHNDHLKNAEVHIIDGMCSDNVYWKYDEEATLITVWGNGVIESDSSLKSREAETVVISEGITEIGDNAFSGMTKLKNVVFSKSVTSIGSYAFSGCTGLKNIDIPDSVTGMGTNVFENCTGLTKVNISDNISSVPDCTFKGCENLTDVTISDKVTSIGNSAFENCQAIKNVAIPNNVISIGNNAFFSCLSLEKALIPNGVTYLGEAAYSGCKNLTEITIPAGISSIQKNTFKSCEKAEQITIPSNITVIGDYAFADCKCLKGIIIPNSVTNIGKYAFSGCADLMSVSVSDSVTGISEYTFANCESLTEVTVPGNVKSIGGNAFFNCAGLTDVSICYGVASIGDYAFAQCSSLKTLSVPGSVASVGAYSFNLCTGLSDITLANGLVSIGTYAFSECTDLKNISIPNSVTSIGKYAFCGCTGLTDVTISNGITNLDTGTFQSCENIAGITIPYGIKTIGGSVFRDCTGLASVTIPITVSSIGTNAFSGCTGLQSVFYIGAQSVWNDLKSNIRSGNQPLGSVTVYFANGSCGVNAYWIYNSETETVTIAGSGSVKSTAEIANVNPKHLIIENGITDLESNVFEGLKYLKSVYISGSVESICCDTFRNCTALSEISVNIGNPVYDSRENCNAIIETKTNTLIFGCKNTVIPDTVVKIGNEAFYNCTGLTNIVIPNSVQAIEGRAFGSCTGLTAITLGTGVKSIGDLAFYNCKQLVNVEISGIKEWCEIDFASNYSNPFCYVKNFVFDNRVVTNLVIPDGVKKIGNYSFCNCQGLTSVTFPESVESIGNSAFNGCSKLTDITVPEGVKSIGQSSFAYCSSLKTLTMTYGVKNIGSDAFSRCSLLKKIYYTGTQEQWDELLSNFGSGNPQLKNATVYLTEHNHQFTCETLSESTCTEDGVKKFTCPCGYSYNQILPAPGHELSDWTIVKEPTDTANGIIRRECKNCDYREEEAHSHHYIGEITVPAGCCGGEKTYTCFCGSTYTEATPPEHDFAQWRIVTEPSTTVPGIIRRKCRHCDSYEEINLGYADVDKVKGITISSDCEIMEIGDTVTLSAEIYPETAGEESVTWSSYDSSVAAVENGVVTAKGYGSTIITVRTDESGFEDSCLVIVPGIESAMNSDTVVDSEKGLIYGLAPNLESIDGFVDASDDNISVECNSEKLGTGSVVNVIKDGSVVDSYEVVIIGDTNGDSWYDAQDAMLVKCLATGLLTKDDVGEAVYMAADCNHDGTVDDYDVSLLEQAGLVLANIDQSKPNEELRTDSVYVEYLNLIDQNPNEDIPADKPADTKVSKSFIQKTVDFIVYIVNLLKSFIAKF